MPPASQEASNDWIVMDVEIIHCKTKSSARMINCKLVTNPSVERVHSPKCSSPLILLPYVMPLHIVGVISRYCHHAISSLISEVLYFLITSEPRHYFTKISISCLYFEAPFVHVNHILCLILRHPNG